MFYNFGLFKTLTIGFTTGRLKPRRSAFSITCFVGLLGLALLTSPVTVLAQSTQGVILGNVKDASGSLVTGAEVRITNVEEGITRVTTTNAAGDYRVADLKPSHYKIETSKSGFSTEVIQGIVLTARQELRRDVTLQVSAVRQEIVVTDTATPINTENGSISSSVDSRNVLDLPANYRGNGSTSPLALIQTLPGVQPDNDAGSFSVQGGLPSQSETSVDGISTQNTTSNFPLSDAFPSAESIAELRVDGVGNNAEYGQPGEVTSISKAGTNSLHGALFWYHQNRAFDSHAFGDEPGFKPQKIGNDFGFTVGGPVLIPHVYSGRNKTFFFATYEGFRFPRGQSVQETVPTDLMRSGDFSNEVGSGVLLNPFTGLPYANNTIPSSAITAASQQFLTLYPSPNTGDLTTLHKNNYTSSKDSSYYSSQFDIRGDQNLGSRAQLFARYTWKNVHTKAPNALLVPSSDNIDQYRILVLSFNYTLKPTLLNEFRFGFTLNPSGSTNSFDGPGFANKATLTGVGPTFPFNGIADLGFSSVISNLSADRLSSITKSRVFQFNDNVEWTKGRHAFKFGFDLRKIEAVTPLGFFGADNYGTFSFSGTFTGNDFANFMLGLPDQTNYDVVSHDNDGRSLHYHLFAQDNWQVTPRLTLTYGLRWEFHPAYHDPSGNIGNFDPSVPRSGRVVYPDGKQALLSAGFLANFNACPAPDQNGAPCTPVLSNSEAGLPSGLRTATKHRFMPRFGFAYRPFNNEKTAIRGGFGVYNITLLGRNFYSLTGTLQSDTRTFNNFESPTGPAYQWPAINPGGSGLGNPSYGSAYFGTANDIKWKDPYSMQWNLSVDHELPGGIGVRVSYIGMKTNQLVWAPNLNDMTPSTTWAGGRPLSDRPFPNWGTIQVRSNGATALYNSMQMEVHRNFRSGLSFNTSYTLAKNVADNQGPDIRGFAGENGGARATYRFNRHLDYGNVYGTRRQRWLTTAIYELPFGRGKTFGRNMGWLANSIVGGWQMSNIFVWQTGPYLSPYFSGGDPSGTGSGDPFGRDQHPDRVGSGVPQHRNRTNWIDPSAFICPGQTGWNPGDNCTIGSGKSAADSQAPIGRFGNSGVGIIEGPGTVNLSTALSKSVDIGERVKLKASVSFTNVLNHTNLSDPDLNISDPRNPNSPGSGFGTISSARGSDFGGSRTGQVSLRLEF